eukprot:jgi/Mesvir1/240/Mv13583-RA.1
MRGIRSTTDVPNLYSLEVLVTSVRNECMPALPALSSATIAIRLLDFPMLFIKPKGSQTASAPPSSALDNYDASTSGADSTSAPPEALKFDAGKSCLFKAVPDELERLLLQMPLYVMLLTAPSATSTRSSHPGRSGNAPLGLHGDAQLPSQHPRGASSPPRLLCTGALPLITGVLLRETLELCDLMVVADIAVRLTCYGAVLLRHLQSQVTPPGLEPSSHQVLSQDRTHAVTTSSSMEMLASGSLGGVCLPQDPMNSGGDTASRHGVTEGEAAPHQHLIKPSSTHVEADEGTSSLVDDRRNPFGAHAGKASTAEGRASRGGRRVELLQGEGAQLGADEAMDGSNTGLEGSRDPRGWMVSVADLAGVDADAARLGEKDAPRGPLERIKGGGGGGDDGGGGRKQRRATWKQALYPRPAPPPLYFAHEGGEGSEERREEGGVRVGGPVSGGFQTRGEARLGAAEDPSVGAPFGEGIGNATSDSLPKDVGRAAGMTATARSAVRQVAAGEELASKQAVGGILAGHRVTGTGIDGAGRQVPPDEVVNRNMDAMGGRSVWKVDAMDLSTCLGKREHRDGAHNGQGFGIAWGHRAGVGVGPIHDDVSVTDDEGGRGREEEEEEGLSVLVGSGRFGGGDGGRGGMRDSGRVRVRAKSPGQRIGKAGVAWSGYEGGASSEVDEFGGRGRSVTDASGRAGESTAANQSAGTPSGVLTALLSELQQLQRFTGKVMAASLQGAPPPVTAIPTSLAAWLRPASMVPGAGTRPLSSGHKGHSHDTGAWLPGRKSRGGPSDRSGDGARPDKRPSSASSKGAAAPTFSSQAKAHKIAATGGGNGPSSRHLAAPGAARAASQGKRGRPRSAPPGSSPGRSRDGRNSDRKAPDGSKRPGVTWQLDVGGGADGARFPSSSGGGGADDRRATLSSVATQTAGPGNHGHDTSMGVYDTREQSMSLSRDGALRHGGRDSAGFDPGLELSFSRHLQGPRGGPAGGGGGGSSRDLTPSSSAELSGREGYGDEHGGGYGRQGRGVVLATGGRHGASPRSPRDRRGGGESDSRETRGGAFEIRGERGEPSPTEVGGSSHRSPRSGGNRGGAAVDRHSHGQQGSPRGSAGSPRGARGDLLWGPVMELGRGDIRSHSRTSGHASGQGGGHPGSAVDGHSGPSISAHGQASQSAASHGSVSGHSPARGDGRDGHGSVTTGSADMGRAGARVGSPKQVLVVPKLAISAATKSPKSPRSPSSPRPSNPSPRLSSPRQPASPRLTLPHQPASPRSSAAPASPRATRPSLTRSLTVATAPSRHGARSPSPEERESGDGYSEEEFESAAEEISEDLSAATGGSTDAEQCQEVAPRPHAGWHKPQGVPGSSSAKRPSHATSAKAGVAASTKPLLHRSETLPSRPQPRASSSATGSRHALTSVVAPASSSSSGWRGPGSKGHPVADDDSDEEAPEESIMEEQEGFVDHDKDTNAHRSSRGAGGRKDSGANGGQQGRAHGKDRDPGAARSGKHAQRGDDDEGSIVEDVVVSGGSSYHTGDSGSSEPSTPAFASGRVTRVNSSPAPRLAAKAGGSAAAAASQGAPRVLQSTSLKVAAVATMAAAAVREWGRDGRQIAQGGGAGGSRPGGSAAISIKKPQSTSLKPPAVASPVASEVKSAGSTSQSIEVESFAADSGSDQSVTMVQEFKPAPLLAFGSPARSLTSVTPAGVSARVRAVARKGLLAGVATGLIALGPQSSPGLRLEDYNSGSEV